MARFWVVDLDLVVDFSERMRCGSTASLACRRAPGNLLAFDLAGLARACLVEARVGVVCA